MVEGRTVGFDTDFEFLGSRQYVHGTMFEQCVGRAWRRDNGRDGYRKSRGIIHDRKGGYDVGSASRIISDALPTAAKQTTT